MIMTRKHEVDLAIHLRKRGLSGPKAAAGAAAWARQLAEESEELQEDVKEEESIIKVRIERIRNLYGKKTPRDLIIDPTTQKKYPTTKIKQILSKHGGSLAKFYQRLANLLNPLLERNLAEATNLSVLFRNPADNYGSNLVILKRIKDKAKKIKKKLINAIAYWTYVRDEASLPWLGNGKRITGPIEDIDDMELNLIAEVDKILR